MQPITEKRKPTMTTEYTYLQEIQNDLRDMFDAAIEARDAAQRVLDMKLALDMKITTRQIAIQTAALACDQAILMQSTTDRRGK